MRNAFFPSPFPCVIQSRRGEESRILLPSPVGRGFKERDLVQRAIFRARFKTPLRVCCPRVVLERSEESRRFFFPRPVRERIEGEGPCVARDSFRATLRFCLARRPEKIRVHLRGLDRSVRRSRKSTKKYRVRRLLYFEQFDRPADAISREKQIKGWKWARKLELIHTMNLEMNDLSARWGTRDSSLRSE
jgi:predicted GIY-YIG superfamily endonuclease